MSLGACQRDNKQNLFPQQEEVPQIVEEMVAPTEVAAADILSTKDPKPTTKPDNQGEAGAKEDAMSSNGSTSPKSFYYEEITDEIKARINGKSFDENGKISYEELRYVKVQHWGFDGKAHDGELIVNKAIAEDIVSIFQELYEAKYPIERMMLVDEYDADDDASMAANNTSAFNYREVAGTDRLSLHSYGVAIDINPLYNPYVRTVDGKQIITPENGAKYADRSLDIDYYIKKGDFLYQAFIDRGFTWGGDWKNTKDYQHFQKELD
jgi:hypothetical protein